MIRPVPWQDWPAWSSTWGGLLSTCPHDSFFLSPAWITTWLAIYGENLAPELLFFFGTDAEHPIGACLLVRRQRIQGVPLRSVYLNCSGEDEADSTYIEYNALVARPECEEQVAEALASYVHSLGWDRFLIAGAAPQPALTQLGQLLGRVETEVRPCYYVDLAQLRNAGTPYARSVSRNTRKQNNFTRRRFEASFGGSCTMEVATTPEQAREYFAQLAELHNGAWQAREKPGMFSSKDFLAFHRKLIGDLYNTGQIILLRLRARDKVLAAIYCFLYKRRVYFYQSGIYYGDDKRLRPGFLALTMAIEYFQTRTDIDEFDFLAGDAQYKKSLSTGQRELHWTTVWAPSLSSGAFRALKFIKGALESQVG